MNGDRTTDAPPTVFLTYGGVVMPIDVAWWYWQVAEKATRAHRRDGGHLPPRIAQTQQVLRAAAMSNLAADVRTERTSASPCADIAANSQIAPQMSTKDMATRLGCSERHARRLAAAAGIQPIARDTWAREDVALLEVTRGT